MASTAPSQTLSFPLICSSSLSHRRSHTDSMSLRRSTTAFSSRNSVSISTPVSSTQSKKNRSILVVTNCSANDNETSAQEIPIELMYPAFPSVLDNNQIRKILPHRFPFLLVDRVIEYNPGVSAVAIKNVTINDNFFPGHFPESPVMPGVLMVEAMAQVGGIVIYQPEMRQTRANFFFLAGIDSVRFRKPVVVGDTLVMRMTLVKLQKQFGVAKLEGKAYVGGQVVCEAKFVMAKGSGWVEPVAP